MRCLFLFCLFLINYVGGYAQVVSNPVFSRNDNASLRIDKIEVMSDTTYIYCLYHAINNSWACISKDTYIGSVVKY